MKTEDLIIENHYLKRRVEQLDIRVQYLNRLVGGSNRKFNRFMCDKCKKSLSPNKFKNE